MTPTYFPGGSSFETFLHRLQIAESRYVFVMCTFAGSYVSLSAKKTYLAHPVATYIPLYIIDVLETPQIYHHLTQAFPRIFLHEKLPVHICFEKHLDTTTNHLTLTPIFSNYTTIGDRHLEQLASLSSPAALAS